jgi:hypothetical protein
MIEAREHRILEFPAVMDAREVARELKREGWYAGRQFTKLLSFELNAC